MWGFLGGRRVKGLAGLQASAHVPAGKARWRRARPARLPVGSARLVRRLRHSGRGPSGCHRSCGRVCVHANGHGVCVQAHHAALQALCRALQAGIRLVQDLHERGLGGWGEAVAVGNS